MAEDNQDPQNTNKPDEDESLSEGGLRALKAERAANKALRADLAKLQSTLDEAEKAKLSKEEQLEKRASEAEARVKEYEANAARAERRGTVAKELDLPVELLTGETDEEIRASAELLQSYLGPRKPQPNPLAGRSVPASGSDGDEETEARAILGF